MSARDQLRAQILATVPRRRTTVQVKINGAPAEVELRQLTIAERDAAAAAANAYAEKHTGGKLAAGVMQVFFVVACAVVPGTDEPLFDAADVPALINTPVGSWVDEVAQGASKLLQSAEAEGKDSAPGTVSGA